MTVDPDITHVLHAQDPPQFHAAASGGPGPRRAEVPAVGNLDYPRFAALLMTLLAALSRPPHGPGGDTPTGRAVARDQLGMLLRGLEMQLDFTSKAWHDGIHALRLSRLLRRIDPGAFRCRLLGRDLEASYDGARLTAADVVPGLLARAVQARAQGPDDAELLRVATRVARRADQVEILRQQMERGLSRLRQAGTTGTRRRRA
jgi:hypothetical protein